MEDITIAIEVLINVCVVIIMLAQTIVLKNQYQLKESLKELHYRFYYLTDKLCDIAEESKERKITCEYIWDKDMKAWVCSNCGGLEPLSNTVNYCCDCGAKVID